MQHYLTNLSRREFHFSSLQKSCFKLACTNQDLLSLRHPSSEERYSFKSLFDKSQSKTLSYIILLRKHFPIMDFVNPKISLHIKNNPNLERVRVKRPSKSSL